MTRRTGTFESHGEHIYFEAIGDGDPVVLCHGLGGNHGSWWQQISPLTKAGLQVIVWDQRGFGNSTRATGVVGPGPAVDDLEGLVDHLSLSPVHLVGQSMGGWVAMGGALRLGQRTASLTLTDTLAGVFTEEIVSIVSKSVRLDGGLTTSETGGHPALSEGFRTEHPDLVALYEQISSYGDKPSDGEILALLGSTRFDPADVRQLGVPALCIVGALDTLCPPAAMQALAELLGGAPLAILEGCGHSPYFEDPANWNAMVLDFIDRHRTPR